MKIFEYNTIIIGSGAAGFNAADRLFRYGQKDIAIVTEGIKRGTSRNTGSDKQTYYKLSLCGNDSDSVGKMAETLFQGQCMDGDLALCEAALSAQSFYKLVELGVPFPKNRYGEYVGYKTDHDPSKRATSVGPYTSKKMTEVLEQAVKQDGITIYDHYLVIRILSDGKKAYGVICLDTEHAEEEEKRFVAFCSKNIIFATGGPAGMYANSVYPVGHYGATGLAFRAGVKGRNLTEWQFGLSSIKPRWNVSGTYMQVLPRFVSTDQEGNNEREFLFDFFEEEGELLSKVFLKGYQWPFDVRKLSGGSSIIDALVYLESKKGRRVFLDFRENPGKKEINFSTLTQEAREYLEKADACFGTPLTRLEKMNRPAIDFYLDKGVDLSKEMLEIALCAQHNNGGLAVDCWWQTNIEGFFACGEVAGTHGVYRPGGTALNSGQVGSTRAAQYIASLRTGSQDRKMFNELLDLEISGIGKICNGIISDEDTLTEVWKHTTERMNQIGGAIRNAKMLKTGLKEIEKEYSELYSNVKIKNSRSLWKFFRLEEVLVCQRVYLEAMLDYACRSGKSRGSALYTNEKGEKAYSSLPEEFRYELDDGEDRELVQEIIWSDSEVEVFWRKVRPIPEESNFFENVWSSFRENKNIY